MKNVKVVIGANFGSELRGNKTRLNLGKTAFKPAMKEIAKEIGSEHDNHLTVHILKSLLSCGTKT